MFLKYLCVWKVTYHLSTNTISNVHFGLHYNNMLWNGTEDGDSDSD